MLIIVKPQIFVPMKYNDFTVIWSGCYTRMVLHVHFNLSIYRGLMH